MPCLRQFDTVVAEFRPGRRDDLKPGATASIGAIAVWEAAWVVEGGQFAGQWAMIPVGPSEGWPFAWVPECDLTVAGEG